MTGQRWERVGALPSREPVAHARWRESTVLSHGAAVFRFDDGRWHRMGEHLPGVTVLTPTSDDRLLAGGALGVHRWDDVAGSWQPLVALLDVVGLADAGPDLVAATSHDGVFRSSDDGATWRPHTAGLPDQRIERMRSTHTGLFVSTPRGSFVLPPGAPRWQATDEQPDPELVDPPWRETGTLGMPPPSPLGSMRQSDGALEWFPRDGSVHRSTDGGRHWRLVAGTTPALPRVPGLPAELRELHQTRHGVVAVVERREATSRWTAVMRASGPDGPWAPILSTTGSAPVVLAQHESTLTIAIGSRIFRGCLESGSRPRPVGSLPDPEAVVVAVAVDEHRTVAATGDGVWISRTDGRTWERSLSSNAPILVLSLERELVAVDADGWVHVERAQEVEAA